MKKFLLCASVFIGGLQVVNAQPSLKKMLLGQPAGRQQNQASPAFKMELTQPTQASLIFSKDAAVRQDDVAIWLAGQLQLRSGIDVLAAEGMFTITAENLTVKKLHQYYKGVKVEHGVINTTGELGATRLMQMEFYSIPDGFNTQPGISESQALASALEFINASKYIWVDSAGKTIESEFPHGALVIISTYKNDSSVCLAYKFQIHAVEPFSSAEIYINAQDGSVVFSNELVETSNATGSADTRYSGTQTIVTDFGNTGDAAKPYRLYQERNGHIIEVRDIQSQAYTPATPTYGITDNNNNWTAAEYTSASKDNLPLDAMFNLQVISDYWSQVHLRKGWDDNNGKISCYVHGVMTTGVAMNNAFWWGYCNCLVLGDGNSATSLPRGGIDAMGHEMGHSICQSTANLQYRWESGALNEGFSDIWAACVTNYLKVHYPAVPGNKLTWIEGEEYVNPASAKPGIRDMQTPQNFSQPDTYGDKAHFWQDATYGTCPVLTSGSGGNDLCGVHKNSGVLNKWFYLITQGENGVNSKGTAYNIKGLGFGISQKIAYLTELNLTPNANFSIARIVSTNAAIALYGENSDTVRAVKAAWVAVGVDSNIYDMSNTPIFTTDKFTAIEIGKDGNIWAGTNYGGLYQYNGSAWAKRAEIPNVRINHIKADKNGGIWVAQSGTQANAGQAIAGGVNYFPDATAPGQFFTNSVQNQIPSRNARCMYVDTFLLNGTQPKVWVGMGTFLRTSDLVSQSGMLGQGYYTSGKQFLPVSAGINVTDGTRSCLSVGGKQGEVWTFVQANSGVNQLLQYNSVTNALIATYDATQTPGIPSGFVVRSICFDAKGKGWFGLANGGVLVRDGNNVWHNFNDPVIFPPGTSCNYNSIASDQYGDVFIGTTNGLVYFNHGDGNDARIDIATSYKYYTTVNGLPGNNINSIAYDNQQYRLLVATDNGIVFWQRLCYQGRCTAFPAPLYADAASTKDGNWSDATVWSSGKVPDSATVVSLTHAVVVDINAKCRNLTVKSPGGVHINAGIKLELFYEDDQIIMIEQDRKE